MKLEEDRANDFLVGRQYTVVHHLAIDDISALDQYPWESCGQMNPSLLIHTYIEPTRNKAPPLPYT
ncbi:MAG TPA: hypothetical protein VFQ43_16680 [Nitrososphaera sp.]|nr:hypothetical protein [Nitrososphaera sp.]